jgi:hypothetical protein
MPCPKAATSTWVVRSTAQTPRMRQPLQLRLQPLRPLRLLRQLRQQLLRRGRPQLLPVRRPAELSMCEMFMGAGIRWGLDLGEPRLSG